MRKKLINNLGYIVFAFSCASAFSQQYGLSFYGHNVHKDDRTGIELSPDQEISFRDDFELSFDLSFHRTEKSTYGYVFRIILNGESNIDLIHGNRNKLRDFTIVAGDKQSEIAFNLDSYLLNDNWTNFRVKFLLNEDKIILYERDSFYVDSKIDLEPNSRASISFGTCFKEDFISTDVPPIMIRDIKLYEKGRLEFHWPLDVIEGGSAYDIIKNRSARVRNPDWIRKMHLNWERIQELDLKGKALVALNQPEERIYILGEDFLVDYDANLHSLDTIVYANKPEFLIRGWQAVYDHLTNRVICYNANTRQVFFTDPVSGETTQADLLPTGLKEYAHHNRYYREIDSTLFILNGYGHYLYRNRVLRYQIGTGLWEELSVSGNRPTPRYLAASGFMNDTIYVLGGYGSESGKQQLNPRHFYDLYALSLYDLNFIKKDSFPNPSEDFCFANSMVFDPDSRSYYSLVFPEFRYDSYLQLVRGSLDNGSLERLGDLIPYSFHDVNSYADLYYFPVAEKMAAITMFSEDFSRTIINLYSLRYPPIKGEKVQAGKWKASYLYLILVLLIIVPSLIWLIVRNRSGKLRTAKSTGRDETNWININSQDTGHQKNSLEFFGGFQVFNRENIDITNKFSPLLKELFLLIFLHSIKNDKGISASRIIEILWFEKSEQNARNNLSVNITKLKSILDELDGCELNHKTGYWKFIQKSGVIHNDYCEAETIINSKEIPSSKLISHLNKIANKGPFLINLNYEWLDIYKAKISDRIADTLLSFAGSMNVGEYSELIIDLTDCILNFDIVNEEAMELKCRALHEHGKHSAAKNTYQNFCNEYKILYGEDYRRTFPEIIHLP